MLSFELEADESFELEDVLLELELELEDVLLELELEEELLLSFDATVPETVTVEILDAVTIQQTEHTHNAKTVTTETSLESTGESYSWLFFIFRVTPFMDC